MTDTTAASAQTIKQRSIKQQVKQRLSSAVIVSTSPDALNSNTAIRDYVADGFAEAFEEAALAKCPIEVAADVVADRKPELVLAVGSIAVDSVDFYPLRKACDRVGSYLAFWLHDDPYEFDYAEKINGIADMIFTNDAWALEHYDHPNVWHLPMAGSRKVHYRPIEPNQTRDITAFFCGVAYANRVSFFRQASKLLSEHRTVVNGALWPSDLTFAQNIRLSPYQLADYAANSLLTFNIGRNFNIANRRFNITPSTPGPRTFEVALAGCAQLFLLDSLEIEKYFDSDTEIILFDSISDIKAVFERMNDEPEWLINIAIASQDRALREHCYQHRAETIFEVVSAYL